ncbi:MAG: anthranilate phosphoribosyltransferase [candidate division Zixibacteria bacterium]|nr:anthranilate phosphoribosyltransferase [candidate division Zixibacteria bacterium]
MIREAIDAAVAGRSLTMEEASSVMREIMDGEATPAQLGAFLTALRLKGETTEEIAGMATVMREMALRVDVDGPLIDTVGTGGDGKNTFNISTATAFVAAGAGLKVAKHGNRAASSACGSADVLEALGVNIDPGVEKTEQNLRDLGICFMFAPRFHPAMKYAMPARRELGVRTVFNMLGPLSNPARVKRQLLGVYSREVMSLFANALVELDVEHALVVYSSEGMDEISSQASTFAIEVKSGSLKEYSITPNDFGLANPIKGSLAGGDSERNAEIMRETLSGAMTAYREATLVNAAATLYVAGKSSDLREGYEVAEKAIDDGRAKSILDSWIQS